MDDNIVCNENDKDEVYCKAVSKMDLKTVWGYKAAVDLLEQIPDWKDSNQKLLFCKEKIDQAKAEQDEINRQAQEMDRKYKQSQKRKKKICMLFILIFVLLLFCIKPITYRIAISHFKSGDNEGAISLFDSIGDYKDSFYYRGKAISRIQIKNIMNSTRFKKGDKIKYGLYQLDNNESNGLEELEWTILEIIDGKILVLCDEVVDYKTYNSENENVVWETSSIRNWLNGDFFSEAFMKEQQGRIISTDNENSSGWYFLKYENGFNYWEYKGRNQDTQDLIFLLSVEEFIDFNENIENSYYYDEAIVLTDNVSVTPSVHADWWLRSSGEDDLVCGVGDDGRIMMTNPNKNLGIRPAMWLKLY